MRHSQDVLAIMTRELQQSSFTCPIADADQREAHFQACAQVLAAIKDPVERASQAMNFAMGFAVRGVPSEMVLKKLEGR